MQTCPLAFMVFKYSELQMSSAIQKLSCKTSCKTPLFLIVHLLILFFKLTLIIKVWRSYQLFWKFCQIKCSKIKSVQLFICCDYFNVRLVYIYIMMIWFLFSWMFCVPWFSHLFISCLQKNFMYVMCNVNFVGINLNATWDIGDDQIHKLVQWRSLWSMMNWSWGKL
jgi:hypothetical protein